LPGLHLEQLQVTQRRRHPFDSRLWREWCFARVAFRHFRVRLAIMLVILLSGGGLFLLYEPDKQHTLLEAMYYAWSLVFADAPEAFPKHSLVLQVMFFVIPVLGLTVIIEGIVDFALMLRDRRRAERSWCVTMSAALKDHIVLVGLGRLGFRIFKLLRKLGEAVVVIERDANNQFLEEVRRDGSPVLLCDARREAILSDANLAHARSIIVATNDDLANLEIALDARRIHPKIRVVLRMFDQNMADKIRDGFNIHIAMSTAALSSPTFAMAAVEPSVVGTLVVGNRLVVMQRWTVHQGGPLCGLTVGDVLTRFGFGIIERQPKIGDTRLFPPPATLLEAGDQIILQGPYEAVAELRRKAAA